MLRLCLLNSLAVCFTFHGLLFPEEFALPILVPDDLLPLVKALLHYFLDPRVTGPKVKVPPLARLEVHLLPDLSAFPHDLLFVQQDSAFVFPDDPVTESAL